MKLLILLTMVACLQVSGRGFGQSVTLSLDNAPLEKAFKEINKQTGYSFVYTRAQLKNTLPVSCQVKNGNLKEVLELCFRNQPLSFVIEDRYIIIQTRNPLVEKATPALPIDIKGRVLNENGDPVSGATVSIKGSKYLTITDADGGFLLSGVGANDVLIVTGAEMESKEIRIVDNSFLEIVISQKIGSLDETIIKGYYTTSRKLNTGTVGKISSKDIRDQPVSNPLATLQGRISGLLVTQANGMPGSGFSVMIRGRNSIQNGTSPLYVVDGVPFVSDADRLTQKIQFNAASPFNTINTEDIESIEVLKDADATSIYGSRGANGVILITTKKAIAGKARVELNAYSGWGTPTRSLKQMNTKQYLQMRREAFSNDGISPTLFNAPDLLVWDTLRYNDWRKLLIGETARSNNIQLRFSAGTNTLRFSLNSGLYKETTVYPGEAGNIRKSVSLNVVYKSPNEGFSTSINAGFGSDRSKLYQQDLVQFINTVPNAPSPIDSNGKLNWEENGVDFDNPLAEIFRRYQAITDRLTSSANLNYKLNKLTLKANLGYNSISVNEKTSYPIYSQNPAFNPEGAADFAVSNLKTWIVEPHAEYNETILKKGKLAMLVGASWQQNLKNSHSTSAYGYKSDYLLSSTVGAPIVTTSVLTDLYYRYQSIFGRLGYNHAGQYLLSLTFRRDGSSRFGPDKRFGNFWSIGSGWIFTEQKVIKEKLKFLSYGKIKTSYGITGNDQIGDYQYLDTWSGTSFTYQGSTGLFPSRITNPDYSWERKANVDLSLELGLFNNRLMITTNLFKSRSRNQIIQYTLPDQAGSNSILKNFPGVVENKGLELEISSNNISSINFQWKTSLNLTISKNRLLAFPGLSSSSYSTSYIIGQPLNIIMGLNFLDVDQQTGVYTFEDVNRDGIINSLDNKLLGTFNPRFYGGMQNSFSHKNFEFQFLFQFVKQNGRDAVYGSTFRYGQRINQPTFIVNHWQKPGDNTPYQRYTVSSSSSAWTPGSQIASSSAAFTDASFIRLKNLSIAYILKGKWMKKMKLQSGRLYSEIQNLLTITNYKGTDPENQNRLTLPPLRMIATGIQLTF